ncbi:General L-amino acid transport system permease protein OS=Bosea thiooxidans OX=53254 GN=SAMN05660750_03851 PE=3 SV=1 [Bosea thiooxidans]|uniref:General L-amino acid transport system permease protein n=1 Tax=Bosea thiooxidans TaxID=53254 RepID=A0A1T5G781_9HYPH|nr:amino acid ABC transporter permease [Bosea thiooxidans]SKC04246.1 general L-amino acid transport system permease protein [Bosea thiooxidans]
MSSIPTETVTPGKASLFYDPKIRGYVYQIALLAVVAFLIWSAASNAIENLRAQKIASGFGFWHNAAGFDVNQKLIPFSASGGSTYGEAFLVGLLNTLLVAALGIVLATIIGFVVGVARLSNNWIVAKLAMIYVEVIRNIPLLLQLFFWYNAVLKPLPDARNSIALPGSIYLNNRGIILPSPQFAPGFEAVAIAFLIGVVAAIAFFIWARGQQAKTGRQYHNGWVALLLIVGLPLAVFFAVGHPLSFDYPQQGRFNLTGGMQIFPEFVALLIGLSTYTGGFIAEVVRAGILAVSKGQSEAAHALGLRSGPTLKLVVIPQAMRVIIPPLTSQYLNLTKNSSLAVAIGYPDLVQVFTGTVLNQTGQAVEVVAITMAVYLTISLVTSFFMNMYNKRMALVER